MPATHYFFVQNCSILVGHDPKMAVKADSGTFAKIMFVEDCCFVSTKAELAKL